MYIIYFINILFKGIFLIAKLNLCALCRLFSLSSDYGYKYFYTVFMICVHLFFRDFIYSPLYDYGLEAFLRVLFRL